MLPPKKYETIKQPNGSKLCGACCCAMIVGKDLEYATDRMPAAIHPKDGLPWYRTRNVLAFIASHGIQCGVHFVPTGEAPMEHGSLMVAEYNVGDTAALVCVKSDTFADGEHYVFFDGEFIRDPDPSKLELCRVEDYVIIDWLPLVYIDERNEHYDK